MVLAFVADTVASVYGIGGIKKEWTLTFSEGSTITWIGFLKEFGAEAKKGAEVLVPVTVRVSGGVVFAEAA